MADKDPTIFYIGAAGGLAHSQLMVSTLAKHGAIQLCATGMRATIAAWQAAQTIAYELFKQTRQNVSIDLAYSEVTAPRGATYRFTAYIIILQEGAA